MSDLTPDEIQRFAASPNADVCRLLGAYLAMRHARDEAAREGEVERDTAREHEERLEALWASIEDENDRLRAERDALIAEAQEVARALDEARERNNEEQRAVLDAEGPPMCVGSVVRVRSGNGWGEYSDRVGDVVGVQGDHLEVRFANGQRFWMPRDHLDERPWR